MKLFVVKTGNNICIMTLNRIIKKQKKGQKIKIIEELKK